MTRLLSDGFSTAGRPFQEGSESSMRVRTLSVTVPDTSALISAAPGAWWPLAKLRHGVKVQGQKPRSLFQALLAWGRMREPQAVSRSPLFYGGIGLRSSVTVVSHHRSQALSPFWGKTRMWTSIEKGHGKGQSHSHCARPQAGRSG